MPILDIILVNNSALNLLKLSSRQNLYMVSDQKVISYWLKELPWEQLGQENVFS